MKVFGLDEAREVLVKIKPLVEAINDKRMEIYDLLSKLEEENDELERIYIKSTINTLDSEIREHFQMIENLGGVIKGEDPILIDFLSYFQGRYIWLCWKEDEETIIYWHELNDGFSGRKPIEIIEESQNEFRSLSE